MVLGAGYNEDVDARQRIGEIVKVGKKAEAFKRGYRIAGIGDQKGVHRPDTVAEYRVLKDVKGSSQLGVVYAIHNQKGCVEAVGVERRASVEHRNGTPGVGGSRLGLLTVG